MSAVEIAEQVRGFIATSFLAEGDPAPGDDDDLFAILDSLQVLRLVGWVEDRCQRKVEDSELTEQNFGTVGRVAAFACESRS